ncbi:hypothetical protein AB434_2059 [Heyndrickxia coagulans]|nr:hypothetical protein AB434_2059 [Heyndrickxia coagulans]
MAFILKNVLDDFHSSLRNGRLPTATHIDFSPSAMPYPCSKSFL